MPDFESLINRRLNERLTKQESLNEFNFGDDFFYNEDYIEDEDNKYGVIKQKIDNIDNGYKYLLDIRHIMEDIKNTRLIKQEASLKLNNWIKEIEKDFNELIKYISEYLSSIKTLKDKSRKENEASEERRRIAHNNLMSSIERTIRDIRFNFDSRYDINGKNFIFKKRYVENLKNDQNIPDFLESDEIEKKELNDNLFLPEAFNNALIPSYKYLSERRIYITKWAEDIYHSGIMEDKEKIKRLLE